MKRNIRAYAAAGLALFLAAGLSFGLPGLLFQWQEKGLEGQVGQEAASQVTAAVQPELTIVEKIRLIGQASAYSLELEKGRNYSQETIGGRIGQELDSLTELRILNDSAGSVEEAFLTASFMMDVEGENSLVVWSGQVYMDSGMMLELTADDETGKILNLNCYMGYSGENGGIEDLVYSWGEYLGCHVASISVSEILEEGGMSKEELEEFENEVQNQMIEGLAEEEARAEVNEAWGLEDGFFPAFSAEAYYGDESGLEVGYLFRADSFSGGSLAILAE